MNEGYLTIPQIAEQTGIPVSTVRRYLEQHNHTLRTKKSGRGAWLLQEDDLTLIKEIRACYERKMSFAEVEEYLLQSGQPLTITIDDDQEEQVITPAQAFIKMAEEVKNLQEEIAATKEQLASAHEEIKQLREEQKTGSDKQKESIDKIQEEMKFVSEGITRLERDRKKREEQSFWSRLFGG